MADAVHSIRAERLDVELTSEPLAIALQPRLGDLNRHRLLPVIERVLGEVDDPRHHLRIDRVAIDLGVLALAGLEENAEAALYEALHRALREAIGGMSFEMAADENPSADTLLALLAHYLEYGTLPFWAASAGLPGAQFSAQHLVQTLLESQSAALADLLARIGGAPPVLERLVLQLGETTLADLLRLVEPEHAALILAYMVDLRVIHRAEPVLSLDEAAFERLLWTLAFSYLLRDAGSQFNRKSFVAAILEGTAQGEGADYRSLVMMLARGLRATLRHLPLASSLPAVIAEIARDLGAQDDAAPAPPPAGETAAADGSAPADPAALAATVRRHSGDRRMLERLVAQLDEASLHAMLRLLDPLHAALVISYLIDLRRIHRATPLLPRGDESFRQLLWVLTLGYFSRETGSQFNRKSFTQSLLGEIARGEGLRYETLLMALSEALGVTAARRPLGSSLPAVIEELSREMVSHAGAHDGAPSLDAVAAEIAASGRVSATDAQAIASVFAALRELPMAERPGFGPAVRRAILSQAMDGAPDVIARVLRAAFGGAVPRAAELAALREALFAWLRGDDDQMPEAAVAALPDIAAAFPDGLAAFLRGHAGRADLRERWTRRLPERALASLVAAMEPHRFPDFIEAAELLHAAAADVARADHAPRLPRALFWNALLGYLAATPAPQRSTQGLMAAILARSPVDEASLREAAARRAQASGRPQMMAALVRRAEPPPRRAAHPPSPARAAFGLDRPEAIERDPIYIDNAGLALAGAFLPHLFRSLDFLSDAPVRMRDHEAGSRAVHLAQYLADGRTDAPEPLLVFNKILCGLPVAAPVLRAIEPTARERELCDSLLAAMIARWEIIHDSSVVALRETFLRRAGRLTRKDDAWELRVERKTLDVLVDRVPWNVALIFHAWMPQPLHVTW
jgi:hypothetical protein